MTKSKRILSVILAIILFFSILKSEGILSEDSLEGNLEVHFIDVGQGDAILVKSDEEFMLIDAGKNVDGDLVVNYLKGQNVKKLKYVIGTHPHEDHIGGLDNVIDVFDVEKVIMPNVIHTTKTFEDVLDSIINKGLKITPAKSGDKYYLGESEVLILAPNKVEYENLNNYSVVTKLMYGNTSFIFTGDAENISEMEMIEVYEDKLKSNVLKVGHHGSITSTSQEFLDAVRPEDAVISLGKGNTYGHPHKEIIDRLKANNIIIHRTDLEGTIVAKSDGNNIIFQGESPLRQKIFVLLNEINNIKDILLEEINNNQYEREIF